MKYRERFSANAEDFDQIMAEMLADYDSIQSKLTTLEAENERLRLKIKDMEQAVLTWKGNYESVEQANTKLLNQVEGYREALEKIRSPNMPVNALVLMKIAEQALNQDTEGKE